MRRNNTMLRLDLIKNEKSRNVTYRKRKKGLLKKAYELKTLCDVKICVIVYENKHNNQSVQPETFPDNPEEVKHIIDRFHSKSLKQRKIETLDDYFTKQNAELKKQTAKLRKLNDEALFPSWDDSLNNYSIDELLALSQKLEEKFKEVERHQQDTVTSSNQYAIADDILQQTASFTNNSVDYSQMLALSQYPTSSLMMYKNDVDLREEQYNLQPFFQSNLLDHHSHQNCYNGSILINGNSTSWPEYYNTQTASSPSDVSNYAEENPCMKWGTYQQYGIMDENVAFYGHVQQQNVYPLSASYLSDHYHGFTASQRPVKTNASSFQN